VVGGEEVADGGDELGRIGFAGEFGLGEEVEGTAMEAGEGDGAGCAASIDGEEEQRTGYRLRVAAGCSAG
jgi:hypothetical protein